MLDKKAILEATDIMTVVDELGIPARHSGTRIQILCPCHDDRHFGSCYVNTKNNTFKCFSCGAHGDMLDLVMAKENLPFGKALEYIADMCGGPSLFKASAAEVMKRKDRRLLSEADREFLGIKNSPVSVATEFYYAGEEIPEHLEASSYPTYRENYEEGRVIYKMADSSPLRTLLYDDPDAYKSLIDDFCSRRISEYNTVLDKLIAPGKGDIEFNTAVEGVLAVITPNELLTGIKANINRAKKLSIQYGDGMALLTAIATNRKINTLLNKWKKEGRVV